MFDLTRPRDGSNGSRVWVRSANGAQHAQFSCIGAALATWFQSISRLGSDIVVGHANQQMYPALRDRVLHTCRDFQRRGHQNHRQKGKYGRLHFEPPLRQCRIARAASYWPTCPLSATPNEPALPPTLPLPLWPSGDFVHHRDTDRICLPSCLSRVPRGTMRWTLGVRPWLVRAGKRTLWSYIGLRWTISEPWA